MQQLEIRSSYLYTPLFCEENIWQLARQLVGEGADVATLQVIFISNAARQVVLFNQRNGTDLGHVVWDYHVVLRRRDGEGDCIYDLDTTLPLPCDSRDYLEATFGLQGELPEGLRATLRLVPAGEYLRQFHSDRRHMEGVVPRDAFPPWPAITPRGAGAIRLKDYWDMARQLDDDSRVVSVETLLQAEL